MNKQLLNPGLVQNATDGTSCFLACTQMIMRTRIGEEVLSFQNLSKIIRKKEGEYSWEYAILSYLANTGFSVKFISSFDLEKLAADAHKYMHAYFGEEAATDQITHSNMKNVVEDVIDFVKNSNAQIEARKPEKADIVNLLNSGYYLIPYVNQRTLQADHGYIAHTLVIYGYSDRGVRLHNPGPPATEASEITWDLFMKAWSSPSENARILMAIKPLT